MSGKKCPMLTGGAAILLATLAGALGSPVAASAKSPCGADVQKFCADAPAAGGGIQACLASHEAKLSAFCRRQLDEVTGRTGPLVATCRYDIVLLCSDVMPGGGRIAKCLREKRDQLVPACKDSLGKSKAP